MGAAVPLTAIVLGFAAPAQVAPAAALPQASDAAALAAVGSSCAGSTTASADTHAQLEAMYCGINVVRRSKGLGPVRGNGPLNRSSLLKADAVRRCGFSHTPCGMPFARTFLRAGYLPARAFAENLAWGQGELGSPVHTLWLWLNSPPHRKNLLARRWRDLGIAVERGNMFGRGGVSLWVLQLGRRR
jgi:uncharacterized protein YkwD